MMKMGVNYRRRPYGYSKMDKEDPEETRHRRAQFLVYKVLEKADSRRKPCLVGIKLSKLKIKMNNRFRRINNRILSGVSAATVGICGQYRTLKRLMFGPSPKLMSLPDIASPN